MNYFVTGGTGFIGRFLIPKLLDRGATIYMLVRGSSMPKVEGLRELWGADDEQVIAVEGDLGRARLGVKPAWIKKHAGKIDHFFHLAAIYDMKADAESQRISNVKGTAQAIALIEYRCPDGPSFFVTRYLSSTLEARYLLLAVNGGTSAEDFPRLEICENIPLSKSSSSF